MAEPVTVKGRFKVWPCARLKDWMTGPVGDVSEVQFKGRIGLAGDAAELRVDVFQAAAGESGKVA